MHDDDPTRRGLRYVTVDHDGTSTRADATMLRRLVVTGDAEHSLLAFVPPSFDDTAAVERAAEVLAASADVDALCAVRPVTDALKRVRDGMIVETVDRESMRWATLPVVIRLAAVVAALEQSANEQSDDIDLLAAARSIRELPR